MPLGPIDYSSMQPPANDFLKNIQGGLQFGAGIQKMQAERDAQEKATKLAEQYQVDLDAALADPNPRAFSTLSAKYPQMREALKQAWEMESEGERNAQGKVMSQAYSAMLSGRPEIAKSVLQQRIDAMRNSGVDTSDYEHYVGLMDSDPKRVLGTLGFALSHIYDPKTFSGFENLGGEQRAAEQAPYDLQKKQGDATTAAAKAKYADSEAVLDLQKKGWDITKIQEDIKIAKENSRIAAMNAAISREGNDLKRQELRLKIDDAVRERDEKIRTKVADVESARNSMDNFLNTADRVLNLALDKDGKPTSTAHAALGPIDSRVPTVQQDVADFEALAETLGSQAFLSQIPAMKGTGNLSEKEGDKLQASLTNLATKQSPEQFIANIKEAQRLILKARKNVSTRYGVPDSVPDTPAVAPSPQEVDDLVRKYTGGK